MEISATIIWASLGILFFGLILGFISGGVLCLILVARDKTLVRLREGEVVALQNDIENMIASLKSKNKAGDFSENSDE